ncbi:hypothetical protein [Bdellovibrio sp. HCB337]|uniref:hypothetical protein n=1 Tax=Bdellovibrio sp. HCB337 TaxID=3394358 RepID=UPI0039A4D27D
MRLNDKNAESLNIVEVLESDLMAGSMAEHRSYHEMEDSPILEVDALTQLRTNLQVLTDLASRLTFLNREIRYVMKVD